MNILAIVLGIGKEKSFLYFLSKDANCRSPKYEDLLRNSNFKMCGTF